MSSVHLRRPSGAVDILRVGWARAWAFTPVKALQRSDADRRSAFRSWQWVLVAALAAWTVPFHWVSVSRQAGEVWMVDGASARVRLLDDVESGMRRPGAALVLAGVFVGTVVLMLGPVGAFAGAFPSAHGGAVFPGWLVVVGSVWLAGAIVLSVAMSWQPRQSRMRPLLDRTKDLASAAGCVVSEVVASRHGSGGVLLTSIQAGWNIGAVGVLYASSDDLVGYYQRYGWNVDPEGDGHRMIWRDVDGSGQLVSSHGE